MVWIRDLPITSSIHITRKGTSKKRSSYLRLLSLSEHVSFVLAYSFASLAVVALLTGYGRAILGGT